MFSIIFKVNFNLCFTLSYTYNQPMDYITFLYYTVLQLTLLTSYSFLMHSLSLLITVMLILTKQQRWSINQSLFLSLFLCVQKNLASQLKSVKPSKIKNGVYIYVSVRVCVSKRQTFREREEDRERERGKKERKRIHYY